MQPIVRTSNNTLAAKRRRERDRHREYSATTLFHRCSTTNSMTSRRSLSTAGLMGYLCSLLILPNSIKFVFLVT